MYKRIALPYTHLPYTQVTQPHAAACDNAQAQQRGDALRRRAPRSQPPGGARRSKLAGAELRRLGKAFTPGAALGRRFECIVYRALPYTSPLNLYQVPVAPAFTFGLGNGFFEFALRKPDREDAGLVVSHAGRRVLAARVAQIVVTNDADALLRTLPRTWASS